mmetsp:Transcript_60232/g.193930  ORF Transcript_60232/g.193930 Transcript_60232/m.193930 type:complete len:225 (-) Transcript_60232:245-919(-)
MPVPTPVVSSSASGFLEASSVIHAHSRWWCSRVLSWSRFCGAMSSYVEKSSASWKQPPPPRTSPAPMASISSVLASAPGSSTPLLSRCSSCREVEKPRAPAATASSTTWAMRAISSGVTGSFSGPPGRSERLARRPSTQVLTGAWAMSTPTSQARGWRSREARYSGKVSHSQRMPSCRALPGMSSTASMRSTRKLRIVAWQGAKPMPQLPKMQVVTPLALLGVR